MRDNAVVLSIICSLFSSVYPTGKCCTELTAIKCVSGTRKLSITADDQLVELYVDGVATAFQPGGWETVRVVDIPEDTQVIAVKAIDVAKVSSIVSFESAFFRFLCNAETYAHLFCYRRTERRVVSLTFCHNISKHSLKI